jgi:hypothetical protein
VEPPGPRQPDLHRRLERRVPLGQQALGMFERQELLEPLGAHARPAAEHPLEMRGAQPRLPRDVLEAQLAPALGIDPVDRAAHQLVVIGVLDGALVGHGVSP